MARDITMLMCRLHMSEEEGWEGLLLFANGETPCAQMEDGWDESGTGGQGRRAASAILNPGRN